MYQFNLIEAKNMKFIWNDNSAIIKVKQNKWNNPCTTNAAPLPTSPKILVERPSFTVIKHQVWVLYLYSKMVQSEHIKLVRVNMIGCLWGPNWIMNVFGMVSVTSIFFFFQRWWRSSTVYYVKEIIKVKNLWLIDWLIFGV